LAVALPAEVRKNTFEEDLRGHWRYKASIESIIILFNIVAYHLEKAKKNRLILLCPVHKPWYIPDNSCSGLLNAVPVTMRCPKNSTYACLSVFIDLMSELRNGCFKYRGTRTGGLLG
jgi:hypothetical protein